MPNGSGDFDQFLVAARTNASDLSRFEQHLKDIPGAHIVERAGRPDQPRLIVNLPTGSFEQLRAHFNDTLIIERNAKLTPF
ncbi:hypothetical protein [Tardiphaga sp.]|jgi:hypothetical protein|uniref:hypothetical protein n=1 Tax=Tardiphaga sp. TaxID=1926292 RepID=UPI0019B76585|nr:hypothetical protein [Tardiphaga sp.]MBC7580358.1 hypothetical protein [Tardiphaga sp.]